MNPNQINLTIKDTFDPIKPSIDDVQIIISKKQQAETVNTNFLKLMTRSNSCYSNKADRNQAFKRFSSNSNVVGTPQNASKTPLSKSGSRGSKFISLNSGNNHYFSQLVKMQEEMAQRHKIQVASSVSTPQLDKEIGIQQKGVSTIQDTPFIFDGKSTQQSTSKKSYHSFHQFNNNNNDQTKDFKISNFDLSQSKQQIESDDENENETDDKFDAALQPSTQQSPQRKINQQIFNNGIYQGKRVDLQFKIPQSAVKINKYIDTKNISQQFALKEFLFTKTPKENLLMNKQKLQQKRVTKVAEAFKQKQQSSIIFDKSSQMSNNNISMPSTQISQFVFQSPSQIQLNQRSLERRSNSNYRNKINSNKNLTGSSILHYSNIDLNITDIQTEENNNNSINSKSNNQNENIPNIFQDVSELDPPQVIKQLTIKQQRLYAAAEQGKIALITNSGFTFYETDMNSRDKLGNTVLHIVAKNGHFEFMNWLINQKANPNLRNKNGWTPLHFAFQFNKLEGVMILTSAGGDLNILNKKGQTPLALGSQNLLQVLGLEKGITIVNEEDENIQSGYLKPFNNNSLLSKRTQQNEFVAESAYIQTKKITKPQLQVVQDNIINEYH